MPFLLFENEATSYFRQPVSLVRLSGTIALACVMPRAELCKIDDVVSLSKYSICIWKPSTCFQAAHASGLFVGFLECWGRREKGGRPGWGWGHVISPPASGRQTGIRSCPSWSCLCSSQAAPQAPCRPPSFCWLTETTAIHSAIKNVVKFKLDYLVINYSLKVWRWAEHSTSAY